MAKSDDDIGFDETGRPIALGDEARAEQEAILDHPDMVPVLLAGRLGNDLAIRVFGPPSEDTADVLDVLAARYRAAVNAAKARA